MLLRFFFFAFVCQAGRDTKTLKQEEEEKQKPYSYSMLNRFLEMSSAFILLKSLWILVRKSSCLIAETFPDVAYLSDPSNWKVHMNIFNSLWILEIVLHNESLRYCATLRGLCNGILQTFQICAGISHRIIKTGKDPQDLWVQHI